MKYATGRAVVTKTSIYTLFKCIIITILHMKFFWADKGQGQPWPSPDPDLLDRSNADPGPGPVEGGPNLEGQGQDWQNWLRASLDQPMDSLPMPARYCYQQDKAEFGGPVLCKHSLGNCGTKQQYLCPAHMHSEAVIAALWEFHYHCYELFPTLSIFISWLTFSFLFLPSIFTFGLDES